MDTTGDRPSFEERFDALAAISYKVAYRLVGERAEAEDLAQEAMARAYASWRKVAGYDEAWVIRVTTNLAIGRWRKHRRTVVSADASALAARGRHDDQRPGRGHLAGVAARQTDVAERLELMAALRSLPRRQREVVALRYLADMPEAAVVAALGCAPGTVKVHSHRGLAALRRQLGHLAPHVTTVDPEEQGRVRASG
ncbi:MAG TPA: sigma-70 family RNA polymerase sigma factor [Acidimicrobiales bacterium]|nr:sigma-70 family RNA polymerase sigma factor [Acidimicrobiales bacterium]